MGTNRGSGKITVRILERKQNEILRRNGGCGKGLAGGWCGGSSNDLVIKGGSLEWYFQCEHFVKFE